MTARQWIAACLLAATAGCGRSVAPMSSAMFLAPGGSTVDPTPPTAVAAAYISTPPDSSPGVPKNVVVLPMAPRGLDVTPLPSVLPLPTPTAVASVEPTTRPNSAGPSDPTGVYMNVGGVIATVNGTPIYTQQVFSQINNELRAQARNAGPDDFKELAGRAIAEQTFALINNEIDYVMAYKLLAEDDRRRAEAITAGERQRLVTAAGGSEALARRRAAESGTDFDDVVRQIYRECVVALWREATVEMLVHVSAQDMRDFYDRNLDKLYSEPAKAQYRVIVIDPAVSGPAAESRADAIHRRAVAGEDFARMATAENDDDFLKSKSGLPAEWMGRDSYRSTALETQVWKLPAGQITPVVKDDGRYYIAKLEQLSPGKVRKFEDVQDDVAARLKQPQRSIELNRLRFKAHQDSIYRIPPEAVDTAVDIAMQKYVIWHGGS